jgi:hypothetical protein
MPIRTSGPIKTVEQLEKLAAKEAWFKLVVKIINWKDGNPEKGSVMLGTKITAKEWKFYTKGMLGNNLTYSPEKVMANLKKTKEMIQSFGGFEEKA